MTSKEIEENVPEGFVYKGFKQLKFGSSSQSDDIAYCMGGDHRCSWFKGATGKFKNHHYAVRIGSEIHKKNPCELKGSNLLKLLILNSKRLARKGTEGYVCLGYGDEENNLTKRLKLDDNSLYRYNEENEYTERGRMQGNMSGDCGSYIYYLPTQEVNRYIQKATSFDSFEAFEALSNGLPVCDLNGNPVTCIDPKKQYKLEKKQKIRVGDKVRMKNACAEFIVVKIDGILYLVYLQGIAAGLPWVAREWTMEEIEKECEKS